MKKRLSAVVCVLLLIGVQSIIAQSVVTVSSFDSNTNFNDSQVIFMQKGDDPLYKNSGFDDSSWRLSSLPFGKDDYEFFGDDINDIFWYRIHVVFPQELPEETVGLSLAKISDKDETYFNGNLIGSSGSFTEEQGHACNKVRIYQIPSKDIIPGEENIISIRVQNSYRADEMPGRGNYYFGNFDAMKSRFYKAGLNDLIFPIVYIVFFFYFLLLYSKRTKELTNLLYSLFSFGFAIYSFCRSDIKYEFISNFNLLQKLEFGSMYFSIAMLMSFVLIYFNEKQKIHHYIFYAFTALCIIVLGFLNDHRIWYFLNVTIVQYTWIIPLGTMFWVLYKNFKKSADARIMTLSFVVILFGIGHDVLFSRGVQVFSFINVWLTPFTMFLFVISLTTILSTRFANTMIQIEILNETLEQKVMDRTEKLDQSLKEIKLKDEKIEQEMVMAGKVQKTLLPDSLPDWDVQVCVRYWPLRQVSGDFYDLIQTPDGGYLLLIADVSGHGMPAALHAILAKKAFSKAVMEESSLAGVYRMVNREMGKIETGHYLTAFMVKFDRKNTLMYANAGHPYAVWLSKKNKKIKLLDTHGTIVGIRDDADSMFEESSISFEPGDRILLYTDCLIERTNSAGEQFGETRLLNTLKKYFYNDMELMIDNTMKEYNKFVGDAENKDDLTLVCMEFPQVPQRFASNEQNVVMNGQENPESITSEFSLKDVPAY